MNPIWVYLQKEAVRQGKALRPKWWPQQHSADTLSLKCPLCYALVERHDRDAHVEWHKGLFQSLSVVAGGKVPE